jgi:hypothetical protein
MDMKIAKAGVLAVTVLAFGTNMATAAKISTDGHNPDQVQGKCTDTYFAPNANGVYGCLNSDGSGIVCGGEGSEKTHAILGVPRDADLATSFRQHKAKPQNLGNPHDSKRRFAPAFIPVN